MMVQGILSAHTLRQQDVSSGIENGGSGCIHAATAVIATPATRRWWRSDDYTRGARKRRLLSAVVDERGRGGGEFSRGAHGFVV